MTQVNIHDAKTHLSRLVERAARGEEIIIARGGKPVARLVPFTGDMRPRQLGGMPGLIRLAEDFDTELPEDELALFHQEHAETQGRGETPP